MDEHDPQAPPVDTPAPSAPDPGTPEQQINWQKRYEDLRPQFDRTTQQLAQLNDEEYQRQLMAQWGYEVEDAPPEQEWVDPTDELAQQVAELREWKEQRTQAEREQEQLQQITASVDAQFKEAAADLNAATREWVTTRALNMDPRQDGMPDIQGALSEYQAWVQAQQQQWEEQRKRPRPPKIASGGQEATSAPDLTDREQRRNWMAEQYAANQGTS
jgi:hypothetical protein